MKTLKFKISMIAVVIAIAGTIAATTKEEKMTPVLYHYTQSSGALVDLTNPTYWVAEATGCGDEGNIPCGIEFTGTRSAFDEYIADFESVDEMLEDAVDKKN